MKDLMGVREIAAAAGVPRRTVQAWAKGAPADAKQLVVGRGGAAYRLRVDCLPAHWQEKIAVGRQECLPHRNGSGVSPSDTPVTKDAPDCKAPAPTPGSSPTNQGGGVFDPSKAGEPHLPERFQDPQTAALISFQGNHPELVPRLSLGTLSESRSAERVVPSPVSLLQRYLPEMDPPPAEVCQQLQRLKTAKQQEQATARWRMIRSLKEAPRGTRVKVVREIAARNGLKPARIWELFKMWREAPKFGGICKWDTSVLARPERQDKGDLRIRPEHAAFCTSLYLGRDSSAGSPRLEGERPESAVELHDTLRLSIEAGKIPAPCPSVRLVRRWFANKLPGIIADAGKNGMKRALARSGPYIVKSHSLAQLDVNDECQSDFRRINLFAWTRRDGPLARWWLCRTMDLASRDVVDVFDRNPSAALTKSCIRAGVLRWGRHNRHGFDNAKEFRNEEITGKGELRGWVIRFDVDDDFALHTVLGRLNTQPYFSLIENPDGKAELERSFQFFDAIEAKLPGWTGGDDDERPERLEAELRLHREFQRELRPDTPLLHVTEPTSFRGHKRPGLLPFLLRMVDARYRHRAHRGPGMLGRTPAQVQAAYGGERLIPEPQALDLLLWHRRMLVPRGEKVIFEYGGLRLFFRSPALLAVPEGHEVKVHVDPVNADRAVAMHPNLKGGCAALEPIVPVGRHTAELGEEVKRQKKIEKVLRQAVEGARELAEVPDPYERLALREDETRRKQAALDATRCGAVKNLPLPEYERALAEIEAQEAEAREAAAEPELAAAVGDDVALPDYGALGDKVLSGGN